MEFKGFCDTRQVRSKSSVYCSRLTSFNRRNHHRLIVRIPHYDKVYSAFEFKIRLYIFETCVEVQCSGNDPVEILSWCVMSDYKFTITFRFNVQSSQYGNSAFFACVDLVGRFNEEPVSTPYSLLDQCVTKPFIILSPPDVGKADESPAALNYFTLIESGKRKMPSMQDICPKSLEYQYVQQCSSKNIAVPTPTNLCNVFISCLRLYGRLGHTDRTNFLHQFLQNCTRYDYTVLHCIQEVIHMLNPNITENALHLTPQDTDNMLQAYQQELDRIVQTL